MERHEKQCSDCSGTGKEYAHVGAEPEKCLRCNGEGTLEMSEDEIYNEMQARKDWEAELKNDR